MDVYFLLFAAGCSSLWLLKQVPPLAVIFLFVTALVWLLIATSSRWRSLLKGLLALILGVSWVCVNVTALRNWTISPHQIGRTLKVQGRIDSIPKTAEDHSQFIFKTSKIAGQKRCQRLLLNWFHAPELVPGERWQLNVRLKPPHGYANPGGFDFERWVLVHHISAKGYVRHQANNVRLASPGFHNFSLQWRYVLVHRLRRIVQEYPLAGIIEALTLGYKQDVKRQQWQLLIDTGVIHLMAISGLHVGLIAFYSYGLISLFLRLIPPLLRYIPIRAAACPLTVGVIWGYACLTGMALPTLRAAIMTTVLLLSELTYWPISLMRRIVLALGIVVLLMPLSILEPGFWLSFAAVALIGYAIGQRTPPLKGRLTALKAQGAVTLGLVPLLAWAFHRVSLVSPLANLVAVPWMSFLVMPLIVAGLAGLLIWMPAAHAALGLAHISLSVLWRVLELIQSIPLPVWHPPVYSILIFGLCCAGIIILLAPRGWPGRSMGLLMIAPMLTAASQPLEYGGFKLTVLDVGQGLAAVIRTARHQLIFDTGPGFRTGFDTGQAVVLPYLASEGLNQANSLVISHGDNDHIGGASSILKQLPVDMVYTSVPAKPVFGGRARFCQAGQHWQWDGVQFQMLAPFDHQLTGNNGSCVLKVGNGRNSVLLTGDIEKQGERALLEHHAPLQADVLVAPHHGSKTSSSRDFIEKVNPRWVVYSAGFLNRFHFPSSPIVKRYQAQGVRQLLTADTGAIEMIHTRAGWRISLYRQDNRHLWRDSPGTKFTER